MRKSFRRLFSGGAAALALGAAALCAAPPAHAQLLMDETFDYTPGDLYGQGGWVKYGTNSVDPIQVLAGDALSYATYSDPATGHDVQLKATSTAQDLMKTWGEAIKEGDLWASYLLRVNTVPDAGQTSTNIAYYFDFTTQMSKDAWADGKSPTEFAKMYITKGSAADKFQMAISRTGNYSKSTKGDAEYEVGQTYLVVMHYKIVSGSYNDVCQLFVNPVIDTSATAPTAPTIEVTGTSDSDPSMNYGAYAVELRQGATSTNKMADLDLTALRVGRSWYDIMKYTKPAGIYPEPESVPMLKHYQGIPTKGFLNVKGSGLTADITMTVPAGFTAEPAIIPMADAMSDAGVDVTFSGNPAEIGTFSYPVTLSSAGLPDVVVNLEGEVYAVPAGDVATCAAFNALMPSGDGMSQTARYTGHAVVTAVETVANGLFSADQYNVYAQDATGAIMATNTSPVTDGLGLAVGDEITDLYGNVQQYLGMPQVVAAQLFEGGKYAIVTSTGNTVEAKPVTLADFTAAIAPDYVNQLIKVEGVHFKDVAEGTKFQAATNFTITDGTTDAVVRIFAGSELIGTDVPTGDNYTITGISGSASQLTLKPRFLTDIVETATPAPVPQIIITPSEQTLNPSLPGVSQQFTATLEGFNLTSDITVTCPETIVCNLTTIPAADANEEDGLLVNFTVTPTVSGQYSGAVTFSSEGAADATFTVTGEVLPCIDIANTSRIAVQYDDPDYEGNYYRYTGKATVTAIQEDASGYGTTYNIYAQDPFGAMCITTMYCDFPDGLPIAVGDQITNLYCSLEKYLGAPRLIALQFRTDGICDITATQQEKTPSDVTLTDITSANALDYIYRLVKVDGVTFKDVEAGAKFEAAKNYTIVNGENEAVVRLWAGTDIVGTDIPTEAVAITGISASAAQFTLTPRSLSDIVTAEQAPANVEYISEEKLFDFTTDAAPMGEKTAIYKFNVKTTNTPADVLITMTGKNPEAFAVEPTVIAAGSADTEVTVYLNASKIGKYEASVNFDCDAINAVFNYAKPMGVCYAYDPQNLPTITIEPAAISMECAPGEKAEATYTLTAKNCFDYIQATRTDENTDRAIIMGESFLLPNDSTYQITVTFEPTAEGEYSRAWTWNTMKCATPASLTVTGTCKGYVPPVDPEGQEFKLDASNPLVAYKQDFASVQNNAPLAIDGWTNSALVGTRAWWGYVDETGDAPVHAAKVTAYDSNVAEGQGSPMDAILVSPALNFKDAADRHITFSLMGKFLTENSGDVLTPVLVTLGTDGAPVINALDGFNIPATPDEAGTWVPFNVDMSVIPDMPDTFFFGFDFTGTRGRDNSTTYLVKDFVWNPSGSGIAGLTADADGLYTVYNMQGIRVLRTRNAADASSLAPGIYICAGRKFVKK